MFIRFVRPTGQRSTSRKFLEPVTGVLAALALATHASAAVTAVGGLVVANAHADATPSFGVFVTDAHQGTAFALGLPTLTAHAEAHVAFPSASANDSETVSLALSDAQNGAVTFGGLTDASTTQIWALGEAYASPNYAYYSFHTDTSVRIDFNYYFDFNGHSFFSPHYIDLYDDTSGTFIDLLPVNDSGPATGWFLAPAGNYTFEVIDSYSDRIFTNLISSVTGFDSDGLSFTISAVPEPRAWTLSLLGFFACGAVLRGRQCAVRVARQTAG